MKKITYLLLAGTLLISSNIYAQSADFWSSYFKLYGEAAQSPDVRTVRLGLFYDFISPSTSVQLQGEEPFSVSNSFGLKVFIPAFKTGNGTNGGDIIGDITLSGAYTDYSGNIADDGSTFPDWYTYSGLVGFRLGIANMISFEPQAGYSYGTYQGYQSSTVSGLTYGIKFGFNFIPIKGGGIEATIKYQSTNTQALGTESPVSFGLEARF